MSTGFSRVTTPKVLLTHQRLRHRKLLVSSEFRHRGFSAEKAFEAILNRAALPILFAPASISSTTIRIVTMPLPFESAIMNSSSRLTPSASGIGITSRACPHQLTSVAGAKQRHTSASASSTGARAAREAQEHLTTATALYREMDMQFWLEQAEAEMRTLGAARHEANSRSGQGAEPRPPQRAERSGRRRMSIGRSLVQPLLPDATIPSPHADDQHCPKG